MSTVNYTIFSLGDSAITIDFGNVIDPKLNEEVVNFYHKIRAAQLIGVKDVIAAYSSITIYYDVIALLKHYPQASPFYSIKKQLENLLLQKTQNIKQHCRKVRVPVCYAKKYALDAAEVSAITGLSFSEIVRLHTAVRYRVYMVGFLPGFPYMGEVHESIAVPRKKDPRLEIEAGYVGIAGKQTGIYPLTSPGGWQIIGRTPLKLFDKDKDQPVFFKAGDQVEFFSITEDEFKSY